MGEKYIKKKMKTQSLSSLVRRRENGEGGGRGRGRRRGGEEWLMEGKSATVPLQPLPHNTKQGVKETGIKKNKIE